VPPPDPLLTCVRTRYALLSPRVLVLDSRHLLATSAPSWAQRLADVAASTSESAVDGDDDATAAAVRALLDGADVRDWHTSAHTLLAAMAPTTDAAVPTTLEALAASVADDDDETSDASASASAPSLAVADSHTHALVVAAFAALVARPAFVADTLALARAMPLYYRAALEHVLTRAPRRRLVRAAATHLVAHAAGVDDETLLRAARHATSVGEALVAVARALTGEVRGTPATDVYTQLGHALLLAVALVHAVHVHAPRPPRRVNTWGAYEIVPEWRALLAPAPERPAHWRDSAPSC